MADHSLTAAQYIWDLQAFLNRLAITAVVDAAVWLYDVACDISSWAVGFSPFPSHERSWFTSTCLIGYIADSRSNGGWTGRRRRPGTEAGRPYDWHRASVRIGASCPGLMLRIWVRSSTNRIQVNPDVCSTCGQVTSHLSLP